MKEEKFEPADDDVEMIPEDNSTLEAKEVNQHLRDAEKKTVVKDEVKSSKKVSINLSKEQEKEFKKLIDDLEHYFV